MNRYLPEQICRLTGNSSMVIAVGAANRKPSPFGIILSAVWVALGAVCGQRADAQDIPVHFAFEADKHKHCGIKMAISSDGRNLAYAYRDGGGEGTPYEGVHLLDLETGKERLYVKSIAENYYSDIEFLVFSPDSKWIALVGRFPRGAGRKVTLWDVATGKQLFAYADEARSTRYTIAFAPDGKTLAVSEEIENNDVLLWDLKTQKVRARLPGFILLAVRMAFSPDSKMFAMCPRHDSEIVIWDVASGKKNSHINCRETFAVMACWI